MLLLLFLLAYAEIRMLPHPEEEWTPQWLAQHFEGRRQLTLERAWHALLAVFVLGASDVSSGGVALLGLRLWARVLLYPRPAPRWKLAAPLLLSAAGFRLARWTDLIFLGLLAALLAASLRVDRRAPAPRRPRSYAVLKQAAELRKRS
jgi:hypothetical protein